jgi:predicted flavoprotein YhiN
MARHFGSPVKPVRLSAGGRTVAAEFVVSARGVEGGGIYALADLLRDGAALTLDLIPGRAAGDAAARLTRGRDGDSLANRLRKALGLTPVKVALLRALAPEALGDPAATARALKALPLPLAGPRPLDEAISTAGGVTRDAVDGDLMLRARPGTFVAGEMLDWDAPTGGYLLTACLATGRHAGRAAAAFRGVAIGRDDGQD